jgi:hypothetical protein
MKKSSIIDWLIDSILIAGLTGVAILLEPWLAACFAMISLHIGRPLFWVHSTVLVDFLPHTIVGALIGTVAAWLVHHRKLSLALLPSVLFVVVYFLYSVFGAVRYDWGQVLWLDLVFVGDWLLLILASFICARVVLRKRQPNTALEPTPTAP